MADEQLIKPRELPAAITVFADDAIMTDNGSVVGKATPGQIVNAGAPVPTEAEAIAGTDNSKRMTPLTVKQVLDNVTAPSVLRAQAWAESDSSPNPGIPGSMSAKSWAAEAERLGAEQADRAESAAADAVNNAPWNVKDEATFLALSGLVVGARYRSPKSSWDIVVKGTPGSTDHPVSNVGYFVVSNDAIEVSVKAFGAKGDGVTDDTAAFKRALATGKDVYCPDPLYLLSEDISVNLQHLRGQNGNKTRLLFSHTNGKFAVKLQTSQRGGGLSNITLDAAVDGLKGLNVAGTVLARVDQVFINNFTDVSLQIGNSAAFEGLYWSKLGMVRIRLDENKNGNTGLIIDGGVIPGSNDSSLEDVVIGGNFKRPLHIKGVGNYVKSGTIEMTRGNENVEALITIEGSGNKLDGLYVEPVGAAPETIVEFGPNSSGNSVELWPQFIPKYNVMAAIKDAGSHNKVKLRRPGSNFKIGPEAEPSSNLLANAAFQVWRDAENPAGWLFGTSGRISRVAPEVAGGPAILRMTVAGNNATIQSYVTDYQLATSGVLPIDMERLKGKPVIAGVYCRTSIVGGGGVKFLRGLNSANGLGNDTHSGSGDWELLLAHGQVLETDNRIGIELRSHNLNQPLTGTVDFRDPFLVVGTDIPYFNPKPVIDTGSKMFGDLEFPLDTTDKARGGIIRLGGSYLWVDTTGKLRIGATRPTNAIWDTAGVVVGTQS